MTQYRFCIQTAVLLSALLLFSCTVLRAEPAVFSGMLPPLHYIDGDGAPAGYSIELLERLMSRVGKPFDRNSIGFMPWARALDTAAEKPESILLGVARTKDREDKFQWVGPVVTLQLGIITRRDGQFRPLSSAGLRTLRIAVVRNGAGAFLLKDEHGFSDEDFQYVDNETSQLLMLNNGLVDAIVHTDITTPFAMRRVGLNPELFEMVYVLRKLPLYFAVHPEVSTLAESKDNVARETADGTATGSRISSDTSSVVASDKLQPRSKGTSANAEVGLADALQEALVQLFQENNKATRQKLLEEYLSGPPLQLAGQAKEQAGTSLESTLPEDEATGQVAD